MHNTIKNLCHYILRKKKIFLNCNYLVYYMSILEYIFIILLKNIY